MFLYFIYFNEFDLIVKVKIIRIKLIEISPSPHNQILGHPLEPSKRHHGWHRHPSVTESTRPQKGSVWMVNLIHVTLPSRRARLGLRFSLPSLHCHIYI